MLKELYCNHMPYMKLRGNYLAALTLMGYVGKAELPTEYRVKLLHADGITHTTAAML